MAVAITRKDRSAAGLRQAAGSAKDGDAARRMLALALILDGAKRADAARLCGMDRQTLRDWVHRCNDEGLAGLVDRKTAGPAFRLTPEQQAKVADLVRTGPNLEEHGVVRWRRADLSKVILNTFNIHLAERSVGTLLRRLGFTRPPGLRDQRYTWAYIFGAVCPARGLGAALVLPYADKPAVTLHLQEIGRNVAQGAHVVVLIDGAGCHRPGGRLSLPDNVSTLRLPPYSPELNPQENVWQYLRQSYLSNRVFDNYAAIVDACCQAWKSLMAQPDRVTLTATRD